MINQIDFYQISLKLILKNDKNEILILGGHPRGSYANYHDLPGGRIDLSEFTTPYTEILRREVREELGDIQTDIDPRPKAIGRHKVLANIPQNAYNQEIHILNIFFDARLMRGDPTLSSEHSSIKWVNLNSIKLSEYFISGILEGLESYKMIQ